MNTSACAAIILAAGYSSRMEGFKPLLRIGGRTAADRLIDVFRGSGIDAFLVVGWHKEQLLAGLENRDVKTVENPDFARGMFSSVQAGLRAVRSGGYKGIFIHTVDIPLVRPYTLGRLLAAAQSNPGKIIYPLCEGRRGHPTLLPPELTGAVLDWQEDGGLKSALEAHRELALEVKVADGFIHADMDTSADYRALLERYACYEIPSPGECEMIYEICAVAGERRRHCRMVADIALILAEALAKTGSKVDLELVRAGAFLHDLAKGRKDHAGEGARILAAMGFARTGEVVAAHSDLPPGRERSSMEAKIVFLADKLVMGETRVTVAERYAQALARFGADSTVKELILSRRQVALDLQAEFEALIGRPLQGDAFKGSPSS